MNDFALRAFAVGRKPIHQRNKYMMYQLIPTRTQRTCEPPQGHSTARCSGIPWMLVMPELLQSNPSLQEQTLVQMLQSFIPRDPEN